LWGLCGFFFRFVLFFFQSSVSLFPGREGKNRLSLKQKSDRQSNAFLLLLGEKKNKGAKPFKASSLQINTKRSISSNVFRVRDAFARLRTERCSSSSCLSLSLDKRERERELNHRFSADVFCVRVHATNAHDHHVAERETQLVVFSFFRERANSCAHVCHG
jgi:hypothetical protein